MSGAPSYVSTKKDQDQVFSNLMTALRDANHHELSKWIVDPVLFQSVYRANAETGLSLAQRVLDSGDSETKAVGMFMKLFKGGAYLLCHGIDLDDTGDILAEMLTTPLSQYMDQCHPISQQTPFEHALARGKEKAVAALQDLSSLAAINMTYKAMREHNFDDFVGGVEYLKGKGLLDSKSVSGFGLIHKAVTLKDSRYLEHLIESDADVDLAGAMTPGGYRLTPIAMAFQYKNHDAIARLRAAGANLRQLEQMQRKATIVAARAPINWADLKPAPELPFHPVFHGRRPQFLLKNPTKLEPIIEGNELEEEEASRPVTPPFATPLSCSVESAASIGFGEYDPTARPVIWLTDDSPKTGAPVDSPKAERPGTGGTSLLPWTDVPGTPSFSDTAAPAASSL